MPARFALGAFLFAAACQSAYADQPTMIGPPPPVAAVAGAPLTAIAIAGPKVRAPYDVEVIRESGDTAPTFAQRDRFYVQGNAGERYTIKITNPTAHRVEAVVSVDGLDVIDGEPGDLAKRGYVVPAYGETRIEGFRTSQADVATFRFSSVGESYAAGKGKARNVGVIAAAIFEEDAPPEQQIITTEGQPPPPYDYRQDLDSRGGDKDYERGPVAKKAPAAPPVAPTTTAPAAGHGGGYGAPAAARRAPPRDEVSEDDGDSTGDAVGGYYQPMPAPPPKQQRSNRPGLGTEYGESRNSAATFTRFQRAAKGPIAVAELRYNDTAGLVALGIPVAPLPDAGEIMQRETADPFPGDQHFSRPPTR